METEGRQMGVWKPVASGRRDAKGCWVQQSMALPKVGLRGVWLAGLCWGLACGRASEMQTEPLELARGPLPRTQAEAVPVPISDVPAPAAEPENPGVDIVEDSRRAEVV